MSINALHEAEQNLYPAIVSCISESKTKKFNDDEWTLKELNDWRLTTLPQTLKERKDEDGEPYLTSKELVLLMDWKLAFGKFRPMLPKLIRSNDEDGVRNATKQGFSTLIDALEKFDSDSINDNHKLATYYETIKQSIKEVSVLKGVGPATASLILSLTTEVVDFAPPFFSDEAFMYFVVDRVRPDTKIKYNVKEYVSEFLPVLFSILKERPELKLATIERGGWSLKMMDLFAIDRLAEVVLPKTLVDANLNHFDQEVKLEEVEEGPKTKKRKTSK